MAEVLPIGVRRTHTDHLKVDFGRPAIDLGNSPPVKVFGLRLEADGLPQNQPLKGLGGPSTTVSLAGFWSVDASQSDGDSIALRVLDPDGVSIADRDQDNWAGDKHRRALRRCANTSKTMPITRLAVGVALAGAQPTTMRKGIWSSRQPNRC